MSKFLESTKTGIDKIRYEQARIASRIITLRHQLERALAEQSDLDTEERRLIQYREDNK